MGERTSLMYKCSDHADKLNNMRLTDKWCDVTIQVNGKNFCAHKVVLAANLKYFETMLSSEFFQESKEAVIRMQSVGDANVMEAIITYAYTGEFLITQSTAFESLKLADYLCEEGLKTACIAFLENHVRYEEAVSVYTFAKAIGCASLMDAAKKKILMDFQLSTEKSDYLELDYDTLTGILRDGKAQSMELQHEIFDGIIRWARHDLQQRRVHVRTLLDFVEIVQFSADALISHLCKNVEDHEDEIEIFNGNVIHYYYTSKREHERRAKSLVIMGNEESLLHLWFYDFKAKAWSESQNVLGGNVQLCSQVVTLREKLYYLIYDEVLDSDGVVFRMFDPATKQCTTLNSSMKFDDDAALCAEDKFIFICGGLTSEYSNRVLRYNVDENVMTVIEPMKLKRAMAAAIFFQGCLLVIGGCDERRWVNRDSVEKYDPKTKTWTVFPSLREGRKCHAVAILDGKLYVCGGVQSQTVEVYDPATNRWEFVASMSQPRWNFVLVAHEGKLLAVNPPGDAECYNPSKNEWQVDDDLSRGFADLELHIVQGGLVSASAITN